MSIPLNFFGQPGGWLKISDSEEADGAEDMFVDPGAPSASPINYYRVRMVE